MEEQESIVVCLELTQIIIMEEEEEEGHFKELVRMVD
jgi:hypothetical protein